MSTETLSTIEAARLLGKTRQCVRGWCESGLIPAERDEHGCYRIDAEAVYARAKKLGRQTTRKFYSTREVAQELNLKTEDIERLCKQRHIAYLRLPGCPIRIEAAELDRVRQRYSMSAMTPGSI